MITIGVDPVAFSIGDVAIRWYGIMMALAIIVLVLWAVWQVRRGAAITYDNLIMLALVAIPSGIIFSRLLHVIDEWEFYGQNPSQIIGTEGLTIFGAIVGATLAIWVYTRFARLRFGYIMDVAAPGIVLAQAIGRVGCTLNGCCYGGETDIWCAVTYTDPDSAAPLGVSVHPTQVYEIIFLLLAFIPLFFLRRRLKPDGSLFMVYLSLYSIWRLVIGFLRDGESFLFGLQQAQVLAIAVLAVTLPLLIYRTRWVKKGEEDAMKETETWRGSSQE